MGADVRFSFYWLGVESAAFPGQSQDEVDRLLHMVSFDVTFCALWNNPFYRLSLEEVQLELNLGE